MSEFGEIPESQPDQDQVLAQQIADNGKFHLKKFYKIFKILFGLIFWFSFGF